MKRSELLHPRIGGGTRYSKVQLGARKALTEKSRKRNMGETIGTYIINVILYSNCYLAVNLTFASYM